MCNLHAEDVYRRMRRRHWRHDLVRDLDGSRYPQIPQLFVRGAGKSCSFLEDDAK